MTEFLIVRLKGAVHRDWMQTRPALRKAIETGELSMPSLLEVVSNIVGVWPLIVSYLKVTGKRDSKDSLVVSICHLLVRLGGFFSVLHDGCVCFRSRGSMVIFTMTSLGE